MSEVTDAYDKCHEPGPVRTVSGYNNPMERVIDKAIIAACCLTVLLFVPLDPWIVAGFLLAVAASSFYEGFAGRKRCAVLIAFAFGALFIPVFAMFLPLTAYDSVREEDVWLRIAPLVPLAFAFRAWSFPAYACICLVWAAACLLSWRTSRMMRERWTYRRIRDQVREASLALEAKNRDLQTARDMQVRLATLSERARIAREIHDNVGHLLTRGIMQVEALQVVHADAPGVAADFAEVGATLHEAMDTVRSSVHDLRDDSLDVREQMKEALAKCGIAETRFEYEVKKMPSEVAYCFIAVVREALSNAARHSDASFASVTVVEHPGLYQVVVQDNGNVDPFESLDIPTPGSADLPDGRQWDGRLRDSRHGMGLQTMEDRIRTLGGTFRAEYRSGFRVFASVPKNREEDDV